MDCCELYDQLTWSIPAHLKNNLSLWVNYFYSSLQTWCDWWLPSSSKTKTILLGLWKGREEDRDGISKHLPAMAGARNCNCPGEHAYAPQARSPGNRWTVSILRSVRYQAEHPTDLRGIHPAVNHHWSHSLVNQTAIQILPTNKPCVSPSGWYLTLRANKDF